MDMRLFASGRRPCPRHGKGGPGAVVECEAEKDTEPYDATTVSPVRRAVTCFS
jgi:hypothetical protein